MFTVAASARATQRVCASACLKRWARADLLVIDDVGLGRVFTVARSRR